MWFDVAFDSSKTGLATVGYRQYNATGGDAVARTTTGVQEIGEGAYGVEIDPVNVNAVGIEWDTGEATPVYAHENIFPSTSTLPVKNHPFSDIEFLMVDETDGITPETGLAVTGERSIDGGAFGVVSGAIAEVGNGIYQFDALAADMNGNVITFRFIATGAADTFLTLKTVN